MDQIEPMVQDMLHGRSSTFIMMFVPFGNSKWLPWSIMPSRFIEISSQKCHIVGIFLTRHFIKFLFLFVDRKSKIAAVAGQSLKM
jgi:hypothetical protein